MEKAKRTRIMNKSVHSKNEIETEEAGFDFAKNLKKGDIIFLYGDLGYGKTTFVKGVARGLGIKARIISPTFTIVREYENLYHIDLYRIENKSQVDSIGLPEILQSESIKLIEWPENMFRELPSERIDVKILLNKDNTRTINIIKYE